MDELKAFLLVAAALAWPGEAEGQFFRPKPSGRIFGELSYVEFTNKSSDSYTVDSVKSRVHALEHRLYPLAAGWLARGRLQWRDGRAWLDGRELAAPVRYQSLEEIPLT